MLDRQFVSAVVIEKMPGVWSVTITYSYYGLYTFVESNISSSSSEALMWLLKQRCEGRLAVVNVDGVNVDYSANQN
jgi:hypothetical protein